jgi:ketosteroid isomerase-like protein
MKTISIFCLTAALAALAPETSRAETIDRQAALDAMVAAEHAFAALAAEKGTREAFLAYLADDSLLFAPDLTSGKEVWKNRQASPALLTWYPILAEISLAGDLGYDTGPWEFRGKGKDDPQVAYGYFVTVWKKQRDGSWKALMDQGTSNSKPASRVAPAIVPAKPAKVEAASLAKVDVEAERAALLAADRAFADAAQEKGEAAAYMAVLAENARLHRVGREPILGREAIRAALAENPAPVTWAPAGSVVARSGDLGYTFGLARRRQSGPESPWVDSDNYLRIWKKQDGSWKIVLDVADPRPPKSPEGPQKPKEPADGS